MIGIVHLITGLETGGAERMVLHLATRMDRTRFLPLVVSLTGHGSFGPLIEAAGIPVYALGMRRGWPDPRGITRLVAILRRWRPLVLQTWLYHADLLGLVAAKLARVPHVVWGLQCSEAVETGVVRTLLARVSAAPDLIVSVSEVGKRVHEAAGYRPRRWLVIPNAVDAQALRPDPGARPELRRSLGISPEAPAILLPARYHAMKDHANFVAAAGIAAAARPDTVFVMAGAGTEPGNAALDAVVAARGGPARFVRLGERRDLETLYPAFDLVTLSSAFGEGLPLVLAEAMACGIPCVATDSGDSEAIIGDTGLVVAPRDPQALAAAWLRMLALGETERRAWGARARARIEAQYELSAIVKRYEALYAEIADPLAPVGGDRMSRR